MIQVTLIGDSDREMRLKCAEMKVLGSQQQVTVVTAISCNQERKSMAVAR